MKLKLRLGTVLVCLMSSMGCSVVVEMLPSVANFAIGLYNADDYYSKECLWYNEVKLNDDTKKWLLESNPPEGVSKDLSTVSRNNDLYKEVCKNEEK